MRISTAAIALSSTLLLLAAPLLANAETTGSLTGRITSDVQMPIADASVTIESTTDSREVRTDARGHYVVLSLQPGTYEVRVAKDGYQPTALAGVIVTADQQTLANVTVPRTLLPLSSSDSLDKYVVLQWYDPFAQTNAGIDQLLPFVPGLKVTGSILII